LSKPYNVELSDKIWTEDAIPVPVANNPVVVIFYTILIKDGDTYIKKLPVLSIRKSVIASEELIAPF